MQEELLGGDLVTFGKNVVKELNPVTQYHNIKNVIQNVNQAKSGVDNTTKDYANLIKETYKDETSRNDYGDYKLNKKHSGDHYSTYQKDGHNYFVFRGTKDARDIPADLQIATGTQDFTTDEKLFKKVKENLGTKGDWTLIGHSLGGTKAMLIGQKNGVKTEAFNPGYSRLFDDKLELKRKDLKLHLVSSDPISNGLLVKKLSNANIYKSKTYDPFKSHGIDYFTK